MTKKTSPWIIEIGLRPVTSPLLNVAHGLGICQLSRIPGWTGPRTVSALLPNRERRSAQDDEGETDGAASRDFFVECQARK